MMRADFLSYLPDDILCKVDRSSMFFSLETRAPFLNKDLIEYSYNMPLKYKVSRGEGKKILKKVKRFQKMVTHKQYLLDKLIIQN